VYEDSEHEENDHEDQGAHCSVDSKQTNKADLCKIDSCKKLLKGARVNKSFCVDLRICDEKNVISEGEIKQ